MNTTIFNNELTLETVKTLIDEINNRKMELAKLNMFSSYNIYLSGKGECIHARNLLIDYFSFSTGDVLICFGDISGTLLEVFLKSFSNEKRVLPGTVGLLKLPDETTKDEKQMFMHWFRIIDFPSTYDRKLKKGITLDYLYLQTILKNHQEDLKTEIQGNEYV